MQPWERSAFRRVKKKRLKVNKLLLLLLVLLVRSFNHLINLTLLHHATSRETDETIVFNLSMSLCSLEMDFKICRVLNYVKDNRIRGRENSFS